MFICSVIHSLENNPEDWELNKGAAGEFYVVTATHTGTGISVDHNGAVKGLSFDVGTVSEERGRLMNLVHEHYRLKRLQELRSVSDKLIKKNKGVDNRNSKRKINACHHSKNT